MHLRVPTLDEYSIMEVAILLRQHPCTVRAKVKDGRLPATLVGGRYMIPASAIERRPVVIEGSEDAKQPA